MTTASTFDSTLSSLGIARSTTSATTAATTNASTTLDQSDFLTLMTAQMKNQDPFNPVDNTQMIAQMAQMSSVAGISQMNTTLSSIATKLGATTTADALSYVGKTVLTAGSTAYARTSGGIAGAVELDAASTETNVTISDANGQVLKSIALGAQPAGTVTYDWDGNNDAGTSAGDGPYTVAVAATNNGVDVTTRSLVWAPVESVSLPASGTPVLQVTGLGSVDLTAVRKVG
jgi:flagellar basal-body rod modification protein FlgD